MNLIIRDTTLVSAHATQTVLTHRDLVVQGDLITEIRHHENEPKRDESDYRILDGSR